METVPYTVDGNTGEIILHKESERQISVVTISPLTAIILLLLSSFALFILYGIAATVFLPLL
jgi:hypothetical protein